MSVQKQYLKSKDQCKVTFRLSKDRAGQAGLVTVAGEFNEWKVDKTPMKPQKNGDYAVSMTLRAGREYQYRYVVDGQQWITDDAADKYVDCAFARCQNSVVVV